MFCYKFPLMDDAMTQIKQYHENQLPQNSKLKLYGYHANDGIRGTKKQYYGN